MKKAKSVWDTYGQMVINNNRALEVVRMVRDLYPHDITEAPKYDFWEVLGIVQENLERNEKILTAHEKALLALENSMEKELE